MFYVIYSNCGKDVVFTSEIREECEELIAHNIAEFEDDKYRYEIVEK